MNHMSTKNKVEFVSSDDAHLSFCLLAAIGIERKSGGVKTIAQLKIFIDAWVRKAIQKKIFSITTKEKLLDIIKKNKKLAYTSAIIRNCISKWNFWYSCILNQSDLVKISYFCAELNNSGWHSKSLAHQEWGSFTISSESKLYATLKQSLKVVFNSEGKLLVPLAFKVFGYVDEFSEILKQYQFSQVRCTPSKCNTEFLLVNLY
ncbi:DUF2913 family protein [Buttiauxella massiliensis]|uniref:DUF2913 family protein n=1 Tax=Buttiauxella massiliensis TaxID=2831590 RepID=UPI00125ECBE9|nr:DUF2913 family protein [Buttiauxella massiliensis]